MIKPDPDFRPNPKRAIWVQGTIGQALVDRLLPSIIALTSASREPITVFIDSDGGSVTMAELILQLLRATNQDGGKPCRIITVAVSRAGSAAADLLSSGDYTIVYPNAKLLYHGVRITMPTPVTAEFATLISENLKSSNDRFATSLARKSEWRFMFRVFALRQKFQQHRTDSDQPDLTDLECFTAMLRQKLSDSAQNALDQALKRWDRYNNLVTHFDKKVPKSRDFKQIEFEESMLRASTAFEIQQNKKNPDWSLLDGGLRRITDDCLLLDEYISSAYGRQFKQLCQRWASTILTQEQKAALEQLAEPERTEKTLDEVRPHFLPFWTFFVALCHALQEGENELTPIDAFWFGLIDEPIGHSGLPLARYLAEYHEDPEAAQEPKPREEATAPTANPEAQPVPKAQPKEPPAAPQAGAQPA